MAQPNFALMAQNTASLSEQLALCPNIPSLDAGAAILARLDNLATQMNQINTHLDNVTNQMNERFDVVNARFDDVNARFDDVNARFDDVHARITDLSNEMKAGNTNSMARLRNGQVTERTAPLAHLVNPRTGEAIPRFPVTPAALSSLIGRDLDEILAILGEDVPVDADTPEKKRLLRGCVGMVDIS
ncbi:MAG: hypothetical protein M1840_003191 [Geoglossum simile]|nr:MAG: hypothetical protein M1840_003191 [Geoglossum simile]